jgi:hypothetical protein
MKRHFLPSALAIALFSSWLFSPAAAQTPAAAPTAGAAKQANVAGEEHHHALSAHHKNVQEHAKALHHHADSHEPVNKEAAKEHNEEIGRSLEAAKRHHEALKQSTAGDAKAKVQHDAIDMHHAAAAQHHAALKTELDKPTPDPKVVKEHAAAVHGEIKAAEAAHQQLKTARKVKEPREPVAHPAAR